MIRECVDFHFLPALQEAIHKRLLNWARWCYGSPGGSAAPMFRFYRSSEQWADRAASVPVDSLDAQMMEQAVAVLPDKHRAAVRWHYTSPGDPARCARKLGVSMPALAALVIDGRALLMTRPVRRPMELYIATYQK